MSYSKPPRLDQGGDRHAKGIENVAEADPLEGRWRMIGEFLP